MRFDKFPTYAQWETASATMTEKATSKGGWGAVQPMLARASKVTVRDIDELVKRYHLVLDLSKLNILMELRDAIIAWAEDELKQKSVSARLSGMQALLDVTLRTIADMDGWGKHRYVEVACIAYVRKTGSYDEKLKPKDAAERAKDEATDVAASCAELIDGIKEAQMAYQDYVNLSNRVAEDRKTLKIFMAPEFFFRGRYGAYQDIGFCSKILSTMRDEIKDPKYSDWLFVHGTAIFATERDAKKGGGVLLENYALVQKGGIPTKTSDLVVAKEYPSHVDFKHPTVDYHGWYDQTKSEANVAGEAVKHVSPVGGRKDPQGNLSKTSEVKVSELAGGVIFTMDNITFGLEVCRDHYIGRLAHCKEAGKALVQLIPSAGMQIEKDGIGCKPDGIIFNVDGVTPHCQVKVHDPAFSKGNIVKVKKLSQATIAFFETAKLPWPAQARADVAQRLDISQGALSGVAPLKKVA